jgi:hypothetical protein
VQVVKVRVGVCWGDDGWGNDERRRHVVTETSLSGRDGNGSPATNSFRLRKGWIYVVRCPAIAAFRGLAGQRSVVVVTGTDLEIGCVGALYHDVADADVRNSIVPMG